MKPEKIAREIMAHYEKPVYDYHYDGTVIYPEDAMEMMMEFYQTMKSGKRIRPNYICSFCKSDNTIPIIYGPMDKEAKAAIEKGVMVFGGRKARGDNMHCKDCGRDFKD